MITFLTLSCLAHFITALSAPCIGYGGIMGQATSRLTDDFPWINKNQVGNQSTLGKYYLS